MNEFIDFSECRFIKEEMQFITYVDFCRNRRAIKNMYKYLSRDAKQFYKWYVYANIHMTEFFKGKIWDYLNDYDEQGIELLKSIPKYKVR